MKQASHLLILMLLCLTPGSSAADTRVRSGEHDSFTRLVFYLPAKVDDWSVLRTDDGYVIGIEPAPVALDTSEVFSFIPRTRIRDIELRDGRVWIGSDCDCHLSLFRARPDIIAVDMRDGPDPAGTPEQAVTASDRRRAAPSLPRLFGADTPQDNSVPSLVAFMPAVPPSDQIDPNALATAVARATSGGLLNRSDLDTRLEGQGIETRSALDRAEPDDARLAQSALCQSISLLDELLEITPSTAWQRIETEAEADDGQTARALAYLSLGFGAEAAVAFSESALPAGSGLLLARIAQSVDAPARSAAGDLQPVRHCDGVPGLIATLASPEEVELTEDGSRALVATLSRLPPPLRAHLAARLEARLAAAGFSELAQSARFTYQRTGDGPDPDNPRAVAGSSRADDRPALPDTPFFDPDVSGDVIDTIAAGRFAQEDRILIEAWIQEAPSTAEADAATGVYVSALNRAGRPLDALSHLDARMGRRGIMRPDIEAAMVETLRAAASQLGPGALILLDARLTERPWYEQLPEEVRRAFSSRVAAVRSEILGARNGDEPPQLRPAAGEVGTDTGTGTGAISEFPDGTTISPRRLAADAAIASAADSIARSARLRAEAAELAQVLMRATP